MLDYQKEYLGNREVGLGRGCRFLYTPQPFEIALIPDYREEKYLIKYALTRSATDKE